MALAAYRGIIRAAKIAFHEDGYMMNAAFIETRRGFENGRSVPPGSKEAEKLIQNAFDIAKVLRTNVVQGRMDDEGKYKLRIHDEIEKGDNESIKQARGKLGDSNRKCCSS
ncbi:Mitochondrial zinc maintenance protein 1, mitochondrial [Rhizina undulata]